MWGSWAPGRCNAQADTVAASTLNFKSSLKAGPEAKLPTVRRQDWVEGEPVSVFRESTLNELCVFTCRTGRSLRAVPAPSALVAMAHD